MAGGPFGCVKALKDTKLQTCAGDGSNSDQIDVANLATQIKKKSKDGLIGPCESLHDSNIWIGSTSNDLIINERIVKKV